VRLPLHKPPPKGADQSLWRRAAAALRRCWGIMAARSARVLSVVAHPPRGGSSSTPCGAVPRLAGLSPVAWTYHPPAGATPRRALGLVSSSRRALQGLGFWRASSRRLFVDSLKGIVDKTYVRNAEGLLGVSFINGAEGPLPMRGTMKDWLITWAMLANPFATCRLSVVATPRGAALHAARSRRPLPITLPSAPMPV
jgi:hypothetical protein